VNARDDAGSTPLHAAIRSDLAPAVEVLARHPAVDPDATDAQGMTPLMLLVLKVMMMMMMVVVVVVMMI
jgi:ankyrin repeat protein